MRLFALTVLVLVSAGGCARKERASHDAPLTASAQITGSAAAPAAASARAAATTGLTARIGGTLVFVGEHAVELVLEQRGSVRAQVRTAEGAFIADPQTVKLGVVAAGSGSARPQVDLAWSAPHACYVGAVAGGGQLAPGKVEVTLEVSGKVARATVAAAAIVVAPTIGGSVMVVGDHSVELVVGVDGALEAVLRDAAGAEVAGAAGAKLTAQISTRAPAPAVDLAWDAPQARFVGRLAADAESAPGPVAVRLELGGKVAVGGLAELALRASAAHGGRVVMVGTFGVELVAGADGAVQAFVFDAQGQAHATGDLELSLAVGTATDVKLVWDAPSLSYKGQLDAHVDLATQPIRASLVASGRAHFGAVAGLAVTGQVAAEADATADAKLGAGAEVGAKAEARGNPRARVDVKPPKVDVKLTPPTVKAGAGTTGGAKAGASGKAGFSLGAK